MVDDSLDCLISFSDFVYALQLRLYYDGELSSNNGGIILKQHLYSIVQSTENSVAVCNANVKLVECVYLRSTQHENGSSDTEIQR